MMKIVMLGHTGVGKTTYMASLYGVMQKNVEGFRLKSSNPEHHTRWLELAEAIRIGKYPLPTDQRSEYEFFLRYQGRNVLQFSWSDYRGGALRETQESSQAQSLIQDLRAADGIMLFCDCYALAKGDIRSNQIGRMTTLTSYALENLNRPLSLGIILTKIDLVTDFTDTLLANFKGLISALNASELVIGAFIPVACGTQLCNVPMPLLFVLQASVLFQAVSSYQAYEQHASTAQLHEKNAQGLAGAIDWVVSKLSGEPTSKEIASSEKSKATEKLQQYESIREPAEFLTQYIQKLPLIKPSLSLDRYTEALTSIKHGIITSSIDNLDPFSVFN